MAVGDGKFDIQSIATGARLDIQPAGSEEWIIQNIYHEAEVSLEFYDGTDNLNFYSSSGKGNIPCSFRVSNGTRIRVLNDNAGSKLIGYDAVVAKV